MEIKLSMEDWKFLDNEYKIAIQEDWAYQRIDELNQFYTDPSMSFDHVEIATSDRLDKFIDKLESLEY